MSPLKKLKWFNFFACHAYTAWTITAVVVLAVVVLAVVLAVFVWAGVVLVGIVFAVSAVASVGVVSFRKLFVSVLLCWCIVLSVDFVGSKMLFACAIIPFVVVGCKLVSEDVVVVVVVESMLVDNDVNEKVALLMAVLFVELIVVAFEDDVKGEGLWEIQ